jgi:hypothetical protein
VTHSFRVKMLSLNLGACACPLSTGCAEVQVAFLLKMVNSFFLDRSECPLAL